MKAFLVLLASLLPLAALHAAEPPPFDPNDPALRVVSREVTTSRPAISHARYTEPTGVRLVSPGRASDDNGKTWTPFTIKPDFNTGQKKGFRREMGQSVVDPRNGRALFISDALDAPHVDTTIDEPEGALSEYYLRYRVSADRGRTWLLDEPIVHAGGRFTEKEPFEGIKRGVNAIMAGDCGTFPIITRSGRILFPVQAMIMKDGKLWNPGGTTSFSEVFLLLGKWRDDGRIEWRASPRVQLGVERSTRGVVEPSIAQFDDGRILMVMRGSNAKKPELPGYKWFSISKNDGETWSAPEPWRYDDGASFFSPSSMNTLMRHSNGRVFWVGNISPTNSSGNDPRFPLMMGEVNPKTLMLIRSSVIELDSRHPEDEARGLELTGKAKAKLDLSHFWVIEDRETKEFVITYPRAYAGYVKSDWATLRVALK
ncbi:MAG: sialidase family protein [Prosthecobacter sp.]|uniref:sialidase family protein n=1 Tax=Prosthecobacter sp. TaxID=1965333 RepID=UPI003901973F